MTAPSLAVCIPTYNRARYLREALESVAAQDPSLEVVVSDNASQDDTPAVVEAFRARLPRLRYERQAENQGADRNYLEVVRLATADYCWLMGSDDAVAPGAVARLRAHLAQGADVLLLARENRSLDLGRSLGVERLLDAPPGARFDCADRAQLLKYLRSASCIGSLFSYLSSIVVRRAAWDARPLREEFMGSAWIHVTKLLDVLDAGGALLHVGEPLVLNRTDNDSFASRGIGRRRRIDFDYVRIADALFAGRPEEREAVVRVVERQFFRLPVMLSDKRFAVREGAEAVGALRSGYELLRGRPGYAAKRALWEALPGPLLDALHVVRAGLRRARPSTATWAPPAGAERGGK